MTSEERKMYVVRVTDCSGNSSYLSHGRLVAYPVAKWYSSPSAARKARDSYMGKYRHLRGHVMFDIFDPKDPERQVQQ